jgi:sulfate permease, SulP family
MKFDAPASRTMSFKGAAKAAAECGATHSFRNGGATFGGLAHDAAAGANLALTMLPKAMAYAVVAGVPPVYGLYASCAAPALAVAFGSNRLLFTGPVGVMTVLVLGSLHHFAHPFSPAYIELAASLTLMVGVLTLLFAAARLGFLVRAIPAPVTESFIAAAALLIIGTQVGPALGAPPPSARSGIHLPAFLAEAAEAWARRDVLVLGLFAACIGIALLARRLFPRIPDALIVVSLAFAATFACGLSERGVEMVGALPTGLPPVSAPSLSPLLSGQLWASAALLALVGMTETSSISRFVGRRTGQRSDPGREAVGQGLANVAVAFVGGYPVCATLSGTSVNLAGGARGPRPIYFFTALALLVALCLGPLFAYLPRFALAAVVIMAVAGLLDLRRLLALCRADRLDALVALTTFAVTLLVGPGRGILAGVAAAWLCYLWRTRHVPVHERLWRPAGASGLSAPACLVLRPCSFLLYPNAEAIHDEALRLALARGLPVVLDLSAAPFLDADGAEAVRDLTAACGAAGLPVVFAEAANSVLNKMKAAGVALADLAFPTVDEACANAIAKWKAAAPPTSPG